jgi:hypothetical protein
VAHGVLAVSRLSVVQFPVKFSSYTLLWIVGCDRKSNHADSLLPNELFCSLHQPATNPLAPSSLYNSEVADLRTAQFLSFVCALAASSQPADEDVPNWCAAIPRCKASDVAGLLTLETLHMAIDRRSLRKSSDQIGHVTCLDDSHDRHCGTSVAVICLRTGRRDIYGQLSEHSSASVFSIFSELKA